MITELAIRGLGPIARAELVLGPGLTVLTGETGAGKTMVLSALTLLRGGRVPAALLAGDDVRVEGHWWLDPTRPPGPQIIDAVADAGGRVDGSELLLARSARGGRTRAFVGGAAVPAAVMADLAAQLVDVHGQADQMRLRAGARQLQVVDGFGGDELAQARAEYGAAYVAHRDAVAELEVRRTEARSRAAEADYLRFALGEIERVAPEPGEDLALRREEELLANAADLAQACQTVHEALAGDDASAQATIAAAMRELERVAQYAPQLSEPVAALADALAVVADAAADVARESADLEADPGRLAAVQERRAELGRLTRKYADSVDGVLAWAKLSAARLVDLDVDEERIAAIADAVPELARARDRAAARLTSLRQESAATLSHAVTVELQQLAMADVDFVVRIAPVAGDPGADGADVAEFLLRSRGGPAVAVSEGASGGELSRIMLALEVASADDEVPTMVFDEVDAGIGGRTAVEVGRRLSRLAARTQVIVVTHLPQVAAFADRHIVVTKTTEATEATEVTGDERVRELARMLAGQADSGHALAHAQELLAMGEAEALSR